MINYNQYKLNEICDVLLYNRHKTLRYICVYEYETNTHFTYYYNHQTNFLLLVYIAAEAKNQ